MVSTKSLHDYLQRLPGSHQLAFPKTALFKQKQALGKLKKPHPYTQLPFNVYLQQTY